jgi:5-methylcytosine-specific restriction endonuclease McrA
MSGSVLHCLREQGGLCWLCRKPLRRQDATVDHVIPKIRGGNNSRGNLVAAHAICNVKKGSRSPTRPKTEANLNALRALAGLDPMTPDEVEFALSTHTGLVRA